MTDAVQRQSASIQPWPSQGQARTRRCPVPGHHSHRTRRQRGIHAAVHRLLRRSGRAHRPDRRRDHHVLHRQHGGGVQQVHAVNRRVLLVRPARSWPAMGIPHRLELLRLRPARAARGTRFHGFPGRERAEVRHRSGHSLVGVCPGRAAADLGTDLSGHRDLDQDGAAARHAGAPDHGRPVDIAAGLARAQLQLDRALQHLELAPGNPRDPLWHRVLDPGPEWVRVGGTAGARNE